MNAKSFVDEMREGMGKGELDRGSKGNPSQGYWNFLINAKKNQNQLMSSSFKAQVDPLLMKQLIQKSNQKGILHFGIFFLVLFGVGILSFQLLGTYWFFPVYLIYAIIFAFSEAAAHELNHDSVFRSRWLNTSAHWLVCFMSWREPIYSKYRHLRHHSKT